MKHLTTIKLVAATGLVLGTLNATASGFGGGWVQDKHTGTAYNSLAPTHNQAQVSSDKKQGGGHMNSFGGGWVQDKHTGTAYYSLAPTHNQDQVSSDKKQGGGHMNSFGGGWVQDKHTGTAYNSLSPTIEQGKGYGPS